MARVYGERAPQSLLGLHQIAHPVRQHAQIKPGQRRRARLARSLPEIFLCCRRAPAWAWATPVSNRVEAVCACRCCLFTSPAFASPVFASLGPRMPETNPS